ncbi:carbohydrate-binding protein [Ruminiclostridium papyrosolvens]|uniref:cellulase n=1 Tax=Ruminiclostridium papyrosolvens C7 TaxID=1330534 RepID=U4QZ64_9FIRM|nr:carbohydrate-binding protein [Ruminiclostridium papyrosolvens]EPR09373.1 carbohydrate-binding protein [Ruminiclostridium papyrosolvens C7]
MIKKLTITIALCVIMIFSCTIPLFAGQNRTITADPPAGFLNYRANIPHGSYSAVTYYSNSEKKNRTMGVYLPPNYSQSKTYNIIYFLHGGGGTYKEGYDYCRPDIMMDNLLADGKMDPVIVVMPDYNSPALANGFEQEMINSIIPYMESKYSVIKNKDGRALCGYSMGGIHTIDIGSKHYDTFSYLGCFSGATDTTSDGPQFSAIYNNPTATNQQIKTLMLSCGTEDFYGIYAKTVAVHNGLTQRGIDHLYHYCGGSHDATFWSKTLYHFAINIFGRIDGKSNATPVERDAFTKLEAESYNDQSGVQTETCNEGGSAIGYIENGDYALYNNVNFGSGATSFKARVSSATSGGKIEIRLDSATGTLVGTCPVAGTGDWQTFSDVECNISGVSGKHDLYLKFTGDSGYLFNLNWFTFTEESNTVKLGDLNADGQIDAIDFQIVKKHLLGLGTIENTKVADLDANGTVDALDLLLLKQYLLGTITVFPGQGAA